MSTPDYQQALGRKIAAERRRRGLSQPELARIIDRSVAWVSQVERGVRKVDRMSVLESLAAALESRSPSWRPRHLSWPRRPKSRRARLACVWSCLVSMLRAMLGGGRSPAVSTLRAKAPKRGN